MPSSSRIESTYTSKHGDRWCLVYDSKIGRAYISGSDIGLDEYPVYDGIGRGLVLAQDEREWLASAWIELVTIHKELGLYLGKDTKFLQTDRLCQLSENFCPICLMQKQQFDVHHCIASSDGGPDDPKNLLRICRSCHVVLTSGGGEDRFPKERAAFWHQVAHFGVDFFPTTDCRGGRHPDVSFHERVPQISRLMEAYKECSEGEQHRANELLMQLARVEYQFYRDLGLGKWSWAEFERLFDRPALLAP